MTKEEYRVYVQTEENAQISPLETIVPTDDFPGWGIAKMDHDEWTEARLQFLEATIVSLQKQKP